MKIRSTITAICIVSIISCLIFPAIVASAETKTFIKEYTYQAGDEDSKNSCRIIALREVKRLLLEELGTYLESETEVKNFQMAKDQIVTLTAGIVGTELIEDKWDGKTYWLKAKITANPQDVTKAIDSLRKDREKVKELEGLRKISEALLKENERLTKELGTATGNAQKEAAQAYKRNIDNLSAAEWFERGHELDISGKFTEAIKAYNKAIELNPQYTDTYINRGALYDDLGKYQQAIKDYNKAIELNPQYAKAYNNRGNAYVTLGKYKQAFKDFNKAIELNPREAALYSNRGIAYAKLGNAQQAFKDFNKAIELNPQYAKAYNNMGALYFDLGKYQQAIKAYNKAIELNPPFAAAYNNRGEAYYKLGDTQQAIRDYKISAKLGFKNAQDFLKSKGIEW